MDETLSKFLPLAILNYLFLAPLLSNSSKVSLDTFCGFVLYDSLLTEEDLGDCNGSFNGLFDFLDLNSEGATYELVTDISLVYESAI